jgi:outer membrane biogenesis lipoprotein LolB
MPYHKRKPILDTAWRVRNQKLDSPETYDRTKHNWQIKYNIFKKKRVNEMIPNDTLLYL